MQIVEGDQLHLDDLIGASPLVSALFQDEPTVEVMNQIGLDYNAVGNHEFDDGSSELLRMQNGGCHPIDGCTDPFPGASFGFLAANVLVSEQPIKSRFPSYAIRELDGVRIAFIGMTLEGTPDIVTPTGIAGLTFIDEVDRANAVVPELRDGRTANRAGTTGTNFFGVPPGGSFSRQANTRLSPLRGSKRLHQLSKRGADSREFWGLPGVRALGDFMKYDADLRRKASAYKGLRKSALYCVEQ